MSEPTRDTTDAVDFDASNTLRPPPPSRSADMSSAESATAEKPDHDGSSNRSRTEAEDFASVVQGAEQPGLPRLNYNLKEHKTTLIIVVSLLVMETSLLPVALFYGLWFYTNLRHGISKSPF